MYHVKKLKIRPKYYREVILSSKYERNIINLTISKQYR